MSIGATTQQSIDVAPLEASQADEADRISRLAFGTYLGLPDPMSTWGDASYVLPRSRAANTALLAASTGSEILGSNILTRWGSFGFFGPLTVRPDLWDRGVAKALMEPTMPQFDSWGTTHQALFTFPNSVKHLALYQKYGFWPRFLSAVLTKPVSPAQGTASPAMTLSTLPEKDRDRALRECREITDAHYPGLDLTAEIESVAANRLGDTVLVVGDQGIVAFAVCQTGPGTEGGSGQVTVKFGASRPGPAATGSFLQLLSGVEAFAREVGATTAALSTNTACHEAYSGTLSQGYRVQNFGIVMERPNQAGLFRPGGFVAADLR